MAKKELNIIDSVTPNVEVPVTSADRKTLGKQKLEKFMKEELKTVKGIFQFFECPGMATKITVRKYPGHMFAKEMQDGKEYEIPLYVARFLNGIDVTAEAIDGKIGTCSYPVKSYVPGGNGEDGYLMDKSGNPINVFEKRKKRFGFQSLEFAA